MRLLFSIEKLPITTDRSFKTEISPPGNSTPVRKPPLNSVRYSKRIRGIDATEPTEISYEDSSSIHSRSQVSIQNEMFNDTPRSQDSYVASPCLKLCEGDNSIQNSSKL